MLLTRPYTNNVCVFMLYPSNRTLWVDYVVNFTLHNVGYNVVNYTSQNEGDYVINQTLHNVGDYVVNYTLHNVGKNEVNHTLHNVGYYVVNYNLHTYKCQLYTITKHKMYVTFHNETFMVLKVSS